MATSIIVNTTFVVAAPLASDVRAWISDTYLRSAIHAGGHDPLVTRVMAPSPEGDVTYAAHITFPSLPQAERWCDGVGQKLRQILADRHGTGALAFHTYLEKLD